MKLQARLTDKEYATLLRDATNIEALGINVSDMSKEDLLVIISMTMRVQGIIKRKVNVVPV